MPCQAGPQPKSCTLPMPTVVALPALGASLWGITGHSCALGAGVKAVLSFHILRTAHEAGKCGGRHKKRARTDKARLSQVSPGGRMGPVLSSQWYFGNRKQRWPASYRFYLLKSPCFSLLRCKGGELRATAFQEECHLPPCAPYSVWESPLKPAPHRHCCTCPESLSAWSAKLRDHKGPSDTKWHTGALGHTPAIQSQPPPTWGLLCLIPPPHPQPQGSTW